MGVPGEVNHALCGLLGIKEWSTGMA